MTPWQEALTARLLAKPVITDIIGSSLAWIRQPEDVDQTSLTLQIASDAPDYNHDARDDMEEVRLQFDCRGKTYLQAQQLRRAVSSVMEQAETKNGIQFDDGIKVSGFDAPTEVAAGGTTTFRYTMDYMVTFRAVA